MAYRIFFKARVLKAMQKIKEPSYTRIKTAIYNLADNPRPHGFKKLTLREGYRIRVGDFRVIYGIYDDTLIVEVVDLGHRKDIYG